MSTVTTLQMESTGSEHTEALASNIGERLRGGEVIELVSDLGGGKTTFTRGLVQGAGSPDKVASPTFTLSKEYTTPHFTIVHFDFYRLQEAGIVADELQELIDDPSYVKVVEWAGIVDDVLPERRLRIEFTPTGEDSRMIVCSCPNELTYLLEDLQ